MATPTDPSLIAWLDQSDRHTAAVIREHGVQITYVGAGDCVDCEACRAGLPGGEERADNGDERTPFAYTVGLFGIGHPELLVLGLELSTSSLLLNDVARRIRTDGDLVVGEVLAFPRWTHRVIVESVPNPGEIAFAANRFYQRPDEVSVEVLQLTYDDRNGLFPDEPGYSRPAWIQPRPGEFRA